MLINQSITPRARGSGAPPSSGGGTVQSTHRARDAANSEALRRMCAADPVLVDIRPAIEVLPGMRPNLVLTSGPPLRWQDYTGGQRNAIIGGVLFEGLAN